MSLPAYFSFQTKPENLAVAVVVIQNAVLEEYKVELAKSKEPGYSSRYDEGFSSGNAKAGGPHLARAKNEAASEKTVAQAGSDKFGVGIFDN